MYILPIGNWKFHTYSEWRNNNNAAMGGIGILINNKAQKTLIRVEMVSERIIKDNFHGNLMKTITSYYRPTNICEIEDIDIFIKKLSVSNILTANIETQCAHNCRRVHCTPIYIYFNKMDSNFLTTK